MTATGTPIARVEVHYEQDVVHVRKQALLIAGVLGFDRTDQTRIGTAVSEIARNALQYCGGGEAEFFIEGNAPSAQFAVAVRDHGPGIDDLGAILEERFLSHTGAWPGGIMGSRRLLDHFHIETRPGQGTTVTLGKRLPPTCPPVTPAVLLNIAQALAATRSGSLLDEVMGQNQELLAVMELLRRRDEEVTSLNERFALAADAAGIGVWEYDVPGNLLVWDKWMYALYGIREGDFSGAYEAWQNGLHPDDRARGDAETGQAVRGEKTFDTEFRVVWPGGEVRFLKAIAVVQRDAQGKALRMIGVNYDITQRKVTAETLFNALEELAFQSEEREKRAAELELQAEELHRSQRELEVEIVERKRLEEQMRQMALHDPLTQLPNRRLLNDRLSQALLTSKRSGCHGALMFLDLDNFKSLNDGRGHAAGDLLLKEVAARLKACARVSDTVARFGGDEFVVLLDALAPSREQSAAQTGVIAQRILVALAAPYVLCIERDGAAAVTLEHRCTASIGVTLFIHGEAGDDILSRADAAMYRAKAQGRNRVRFDAAQAEVAAAGVSGPT